MSDHSNIAIQDARIRAAAMKTEILERDEERALIRAWNERGDHAARDRLVLCHQKLILGIAKRFRYAGMPFQDLVNEGNLGLLRALETFDLETGHRFSTYASYWCWTYLQDAVFRNVSVLRLGRSRSERDCIRSLARGDREKAREQGLSEAEILRIEGALNPVVFSIHEQLGDDEADGPYEAVLSDHNAGAEAMMEHAIEGTRRAVVQAVFAQLGPREQEVISRRFFTADPETLRDISGDLGVSPERVRQIEQGAFRRMRQLLQAEGYQADDLIAAAAPRPVSA
jgi:RNA polymerase sigma-32 factor